MGARDVSGWRRGGNINYKRGRSREYGVVNKLKKMGALWARRMGRSGGPFDVVAIFPDHTLCIQVKKGYIGKQELENLKQLAGKILSKDIKIQLWQAPKKAFEEYRVSVLK